MISLPDDNDAIRINTSAAGDVHYFLSGVNVSIANRVSRNNPGKITTATYTSVATRAGGAGGGFKSEIDFISVYNNHATDPNTIEIVFSRSGTDYILYKTTLAAGERLEYSV